MLGTVRCELLCGSLLGWGLVAAVAPALAQEPPAPASISTITRIDNQTPRAVQIALAMSAAPAVVSRDATIYVLGPSGYVKARSGTNGFTCLVSRQLVDTIEPECFDAETSATTLPARLFVEAERAKGRSDEEIGRDVVKGYKAGRFKAPRKPAIIYMMSESNYVFDPERKKIIHFPGHIMFPAPYVTYKQLGSATGEGVPYIVAPGTAGAEIIVVPARRESEHQHD